MTALGLAILVFAGLVAPFVLYWLVRNEGETQSMDREEAERVARRDTDERR